MCLMLVLGSALAEAPTVQAVIHRVIAVAKTPRGLVGITSLCAIVLALLNWSLGIIGGALVAQAAGRHAARQGWTLHYPLLCAAGYSGLMTWHGGWSGSAPLKAAAYADQVEILGPELAARVGTIPISASLLGPLNLWVTGGLVVLGPLVFMALCPAEGADPDPMAPPAALAEERPTASPEPRGAVERFERWSGVLWLLILPMGAALVLHFAERGVRALDFDTVNLLLWCVTMLLYGRPRRFLQACERGVRNCTGVLLQFPLYGGIMGVMAGAGLSAALSRAFASAGPDALPVLTFLSAGLLNLLVPSGGGQWAVQGPILMEAVVDSGASPAHVMMAMAYGDQWTNMLQPFWALPLLALTGVRARDIVGYTALWMVAGGIWILAVLVLAA
jgi:short-chain fatty acids transporter